MSHYRLKTTYNEEGAYGSVDVKNLYAHHNLGCDIISFYDHDGSFLFAVPDTLDGNILEAVNRLYAPWEGENHNLKLTAGVEHMTIEETKKTLGY